MADARMNPEAPTAPDHAPTFRKDYREPDWWVRHVELDMDLDPATTRVRATLRVERNGEHDRPLRLAGDGLKPVTVEIDGEKARSGMEGDDLLVEMDRDAAQVATEVEIHPDRNSQLMGLYASGGLLCTQCESEGFRRITFHPDRPDVLSTYAVTMRADAEKFPILLANGNLVEQGKLDDGRHFARWEDPFPKPSYLFALVAGDLKANRDRFTTMSGREVELNIWVREADLPRTRHAMQALKDSMKWDEEVYGREYDLDLFNIVAVDDFNFGAMENKGLNIFNSRYILADADSATDADFDAIAGVVAHEYFHNWSGNRVTCRDWFQLSLKEGFTVFRDQCFSQAMTSEAVKRIEDVRVLRAIQFPEDSGPLAHPVRPESYIEITNFYTATVYNKGAELIRMMHTILGPEKFRAATDLYFERHDGEAATCEDFVRCMEEAGGVDLEQFRLWYSQAGTPRVKARLIRDEKANVARLQLEQTVPDTPGQTGKAPMVLPLKTALLSAQSGREIEERLILFDKAEDEIVFDNVTEPVILSINRDFSAPVIIESDRSDDELATLAAMDANPFARYEAMQELMLHSLLPAARGEEVPPADPVIEAVRRTLNDDTLDKALKAEAIRLPSEAMIGERLEEIDPDQVHRARSTLAEEIGAALGTELVEAQAIEAAGDDLSVEAKGIRALRREALGLLAAGEPEEGARLAKALYDRADNMTDRQTALMILSGLEAEERQLAFDAFYERYKGNSLVLDKWFALQAAAQRPDTLERVEKLVDHPDFTLKNPNRLRSLISNFAANQWAFHHSSGRGYALLAKMVIEADRINPQVAARMVPPLGRWRRYVPDRARLMKEALETIASSEGLSKDVYEQVSKSLG
ncbi:aminopeptidase N [Sphingomicrobium lutaoense]|uniref:Aminopeptidase N n=1 Tax=Sphingomicrobium lutaoense TaxID=515949 RepID=A0A839YZH8_9SPHN|nr:aminopeptidase N [Sphingomicrobium lutaoense]MBB3764529.1 aminopeptidase N [Sphingomicrobium lutaoense]